MTENKTYDAVALFSAGLDSLLAAKVIEKQGLRVKCLHFVSPFFGKADKVPHWREIYNLDIDIVDIGDEYIQMMQAGPKFGFGKYFNPCVDCKIIMIAEARRMMEKYGAKFIITGEVVGQRPMSQRRDAMNSVRNESESKDLLLRPLCAKRLDPTPMEESGLVDREKLLGFGGRGRTAQLELAEEFGITEIPTPGGGCLLTEPASARRYGAVFQYKENPVSADFYLANTGRQYWAESHWLSIGRDQNSNEQLEKLTQPEDLVFIVRDYPSPYAIGRQVSDDWTEEAKADAAAFVASFSPKAKKAGEPVAVIVRQGETEHIVTVTPSRETSMPWQQHEWKDARPIRNKMDNRPE
jgi:tRNA U34 2-thiouridine synthase MnmA/TrmU